MSLCRVCLSTIDVDCSIYEPVNNRSSLYSVLRRLFPYAFTDDCDGQWPTKICNVCKRRILDANELYYLCLHSRKRLRELFNEKSYQIDDYFDPSVESGWLLDDMIPHTSSPSKSEEQATAFAKWLATKKNEDELVNSYLAAPSPETPPASDKEQHPCSLCDGLSFSSQADLTTHLNTQHTDKVEHTEKVFHDKETYEKHGNCNSLKQTQQNEPANNQQPRPELAYECSECGKKFLRKSNMRQHLKRHSDVKTFSCSLCPSRFMFAGDLKTHQTTHNPSERFNCELCNASFTQHSSLRQHVRIHTGVRAFSCDQCDKSFYRSDNLKRHMRIHTGEKRYKCPYCDRKFAQSNDMARHIGTHIGVNIYQCDRCDASFPFMSNLRRHYTEHYQSGEGATEPSSTETERTIRFTTTDILNLRYAKETSENTKKRQTFADSMDQTDSNG
ncbi:zinc finger protein 184-like [Anopheles cruzii]|uniref:zinc finger protein 184-like n=1 Tax=Anopheles cruzii TaxID=68878 RepID=UPI0022EC4D2D|nr:zinc finger protein 184-like [Anopheles cruzii]